ncbi:MAG: hypothetical protein A2W25_16915 [candidate division Zixibacteria bacterium RBG_16_53_22]|nr:MAG: hypothetical protein A2W25_16915 [candidate division Zixibacteria bacterium RBG_16_53_22]
MVDSQSHLYYNRHMIRAIAFWLLLFSPLAIMAQTETPDDKAYADMRIPRPQLRWVIDTPTGGMLPRGAFDLDLRTFSGGGLQAALGIGLMERFSVGLAYGASAVLTDTIPVHNPRLEFQMKYRLLEETRNFPDITVGYSSQGYGPYDDGSKRFQVKSPGFYLAFTKRFLLYSSPAAWHWGVNYSLENERDNDPSAFVGFNAELGADMMFLGEYDLALNDNKSDGVYGMGRGFLNMALAWYLTDGFSLELDLKNLLRNRRDANAIDREARLVYVEYFY